MPAPLCVTNVSLSNSQTEFPQAANPKLRALGRAFARKGQRTAANVQLLILNHETRSEEHRLNSSHQLISYAVFCLKKKSARRHRPRGLGTCRWVSALASQGSAPRP